MNRLNGYPRILERGQEAFDPLKLVEETKEIVCNDGKRKYTKFYATGVYGGIGTGYTCGCCLRCIFCWFDRSRDYPERMGEFYSPVEAFEKLSEAADNYGDKEEEDLAEVRAVVKNAKGMTPKYSTEPKADLQEEMSTTTPIESDQEEITALFRVKKYTEDGKLRISIKVGEATEKVILSK